MAFALGYKDVPYVGKPGASPPVIFAAFAYVLIDGRGRIEARRGCGIGNGGTNLS